jgi:hypothetical protein
MANTRAQKTAQNLSTLTTAGDIAYASAAGTPARLGIGSTSQVLTVASGLPSWATPAGGGKVLQVVNGVFSSQVSSSSSTFTDTGLTASITPSAASSKILVLVSCTVNKSAGNSANRVALRLLRGATTIVNITGGASVNDHYGLFTNLADLNNGGYSTGYLDSPSTTSATAYKIQFANPQNTASIEMNPGTGTSTIVLMEIGA